MFRTILTPVSYNGNRYILALLADYSHFTIALPMKYKALYVEMATARFGNKSYVCKPKIQASRSKTFLMLGYADNGYRL
jgi:hypothetical protein